MPRTTHVWHLLHVAAVAPQVPSDRDVYLVCAGASVQPRGSRTAELPQLHGGTTLSFMKTSTTSQYRFPYAAIYVPVVAIILGALRVEATSADACCRAVTREACQHSDSQLHRHPRAVQGS